VELRLKPRIGVMGSACCSPDIYDLAREVGFLIGRSGAILICGGRGGVMEAAARGAKDAGGITLGIVPGSRAEEANSYIDIPIVTGLGNGRNIINVLTSQAIIAIHGSFGTLSEIALALKCRVPLVGLKTWDMNAPGGGPLPITVVPNAEEAVAAALRLIEKNRMPSP
jgi:uncharacterized protein (TIGR00725 family)